MALNETVVDTVSATNFKVIGEAPAMQRNQAGEYANLALGNAVSFQQGMNSVFSAIVGKMAETIVTLDPREALGNVAAGQQASKTAALTPPPTA